MTKALITLLAVFAMLGTSIAEATPGRLDGSGCHRSKRAGYHCHRHKAAKKAAPIKPAPKPAKPAKPQQITG